MKKLTLFILLLLAACGAPPAPVVIPTVAVLPPISHCHRQPDRHPHLDHHAIADVVAHHNRGRPSRLLPPRRSPVRRLSRHRPSRPRRRSRPASPSPTPSRPLPPAPSPHRRTGRLGHVGAVDGARHHSPAGAALQPANAHRRRFRRRNVHRGGLPSSPTPVLGTPAVGISELGTIGAPTAAPSACLVPPRQYRHRRGRTTRSSSVVRRACFFTTTTAVSPTSAAR